MRQHLATALTIVGAVVGAGFASGREVYQFFSRFGVRAIIGVIIAIVMLTLLSVRVLMLAKRHRAKNLVELMQQHLGTNYAKLIKVVLLAALWLGLSVMLSGAGAAGESLGISQLLAIVLTAAVTAGCLNIGIVAVSQANTILIPVLMAVSVYIYYQGMKLGSTTFLIQDASLGSWPALVWSAVLYAGLNSLLVFVVIPPLLQVGKPLGVVLGCGVFGALLLCTTLLLLQFPVVAATSPIPLLSITTEIAPQVPALYGVLLWTALTTTALEIEEKRADKPYVWIVFLLLLLLLSSIFFLRPSVGTIPTGTMPTTKTTPVVTSLDSIPSTGQPVYLAEGATGMWGVYQDNDSAHVSFFSSLGDEQWAETITIPNVLAVSRANYLVLTAIGQSQFAVYHGTQKLVHVTNVPGTIVAVSVNDMGEVLLCITDAQVNPLALNTQVLLYSSSGQKLWQRTIDKFQAVSCQQSADGDKNIVFGVNFVDKLQAEIRGFSRLGEPQFAIERPGRPSSVCLRDDGERFAIAVENTIEAYSGDGKLLWKYDAGGDIYNLRYAGRGGNLAFLASRKSMLNFRQQSVIGSLADTGKLSWQYRSNDSAKVLSTANINTNIIIGTDKQLHLYGVDGRARFSLNHSWGSSYKVSTLDGRHYLVITPNGKLVQVRGE